MQRLKALIMITFGFSRSEARAFIILLPLMFVIVFIEPVYQAWFVSNKPDDFEDAKKLDSLVATWKWVDEPKTPRPEKQTALFRFNPNTVSIKEMDSLGIPSNVSRRIDKYRLKGGSFKVRNDFGKMYGLDSILFAQLEPFIDLPRAIATKKPVINSATKIPEKREAKPATTFDLNAADTTTLDGVQGIGPTLAKRIVLYRERLGGFVSRDQLYEVWGLDTAVVQRALAISEISPTFEPRKININTATERDLASHPYMKPKTARIIVTYRFQHGHFKTIEDLEKINLIDPKNYHRIRPYLTLD
jgi:competence protein ComEA